MTKKYIQTEAVDILSIEQADEVTFTFRCTRPHSIQWEVGSNGHFSFKIPTGDKETDKPHQRHMSIISHPDESYLGFTTKIRKAASPFKQRLRELRPGDKLIIYGMNNRMPIRREGKPLVFLTMGVGMSACRPYFIDYDKDPTGIPSIVSLNIEKSGTRLYEDEFARLSEGFFHNVFLKDRISFYREIDKILNSSEKPLFYIIGSDSFLVHLCRYLTEAGVSGSSISIDKKKDVISFLKDNPSE